MMLSISHRLATLHFSDQIAAIYMLVPGDTRVVIDSLLRIRLHIRRVFRRERPLAYKRLSRSSPGALGTISLMLGS